VLIGILLIVVCATAALVAPILVGAQHWWPRQFVATLFVAPVLGIVSFYAFDMSTPGYWLASWRAAAIEDPSIGTGMTLDFIIDSSLWFAVIWGATALLSNLRQRGEKTFSWRLARASVCAFPLSLYATTGYAVFFGSQGFSRSWVLLSACVSTSLLMFLVLILGLYGVAERFRPARSVDSDNDTFTTLNLH
jgi:hypothetical protein